MLFDIISDIHLETNDISHWSQVIEKKSDYLIMAGDIAQIQHIEELTLFLGQLCLESNYTRIFYVCGNHEFYNDKSYSYLDLLSGLKMKMKSYSNFTILHNEYFELNDDIVIFGTTLWSNLPKKYSICLPIFDENRNLITKNWYTYQHYYALYQLDNIIRKFNDKKLIVVSHHAPTFEKTLKEDHYQSNDRFMYCSNLNSYLTSKYIHTWVYGHTHVNTDFVTNNGTRIVTNQYRGKNYSKNKQIEVLKYTTHDRMTKAVR